MVIMIELMVENVKILKGSFNVLYVIIPVRATAIKNG
jgi:hypothetical protein